MIAEFSANNPVIMDDYSDTISNENDDTGPARPEEIGHQHTDINPSTF